MVAVLLALPNAPSMVLCLCPDGGATIVLACQPGICCDVPQPAEPTQNEVSEYSCDNSGGACTGLPIPLGLKWQEGRHFLQAVTMTKVAPLATAGFPFLVTSQFPQSAPYHKVLGLPPTVRSTVRSTILLI